MKMFLVLAAFIASQSAFAARLVCDISTFDQIQTRHVDMKLSLSKAGQKFYIGTLGDMEVNAYYVFTDDKLQAMANPYMDVIATGAGGVSVTGISYPRSKSHLVVSKGKEGYIDAACERIVEAGDPVGELPPMGPGRITPPTSN